MKRTLMFVILAAFVIGMAGTAFAADGDVSIGAVEGLKGLDTLLLGQNIRFFIKYTNTLGVRSDVSNGFRLTSPDGATWDSTTIDSIGPINDAGTPGDPTDDVSAWFTKYFDIVNSYRVFSGDGHGADTVGYIGAGNPTSASKQMPTTWNDTVFAITMHISDSNTVKGKHVCIDSSFFDPGGTWVWVGRDLLDHHPTWTGLFPTQVHTPTEGYCFVFEGVVTGVDEAGDGTLPKTFAVSQNYPNPFNPTTKINFEVPRKSMVNLSVYNVLGQKVATLVNKEMAPGKYVADWDASHNASGIYFFKFDAGTFVQTKKMVLMK